MFGDFTAFIESIITLLTKKYQLMIVILLGAGVLVCWLLWDGTPFNDPLYDYTLIGVTFAITVVTTFSLSKKAKMEIEEDERNLAINQAIEKAGEIIHGWATDPLRDDYIGELPVSKDVSIVIKELKKGKYACLKVQGVIRKERILISRRRTG